jgi:hypothetical protein
MRVLPTVGSDHATEAFRQCLNMGHFFACGCERHCGSFCRGGRRTPILFLIYEPAVVLSDRASLIMSNLRTKKREDSGGGYTNQTAEGPRE